MVNALLQGGRVPEDGLYVHLSRALHLYWLHTAVFCTMARSTSEKAPNRPYNRPTVNWTLSRWSAQGNDLHHCLTQNFTHKEALVAVSAAAGKPWTPRPCAMPYDPGPQNNQLCRRPLALPRVWTQYGIADISAATSLLPDRPLTNRQNRKPNRQT